MLDVNPQNLWIRYLMWQKRLCWCDMVRILKRVRTLDYQGGTKCPSKREVRGSRAREDSVRTEGEVRVTWPEAKEGHHPLELEKAENRFCPRAFRGTQLCSHLILAISDFWPPELSDNQFAFTEENNRMGQTRALFRKLEIWREYFMQKWAQKGQKWQGPNRSRRD